MAIDKLGTNALADSAITSAKISDGTIATADISNDAISADKLADNSVVTANITSGAISTAKIADGAVTAVKQSGSTVPAFATGGTVTEYSSGGTNYRIHTFTSAATSQISFTGSKVCDYMILGGGGGGAGAEGYQGASGGAGAGGMVVATSQTIAAGNYAVVVGAGGIGSDNIDAIGGDGGNILFGDGHVEWHSPDNFDEELEGHIAEPADEGF